MCKYNPKNEGRRIDPCMKEAIKTLQSHGFETIASCCGHGKYPMTIIYKGKSGGIFELFSGRLIMRTRRVYHRDAKGVYFIPEIIKKGSNRALQGIREGEQHECKSMRQM